MNDWFSQEHENDASTSAPAAMNAPNEPTETEATPVPQAEPVTPPAPASAAYTPPASAAYTPPAVEVTPVPHAEPVTPPVSTVYTPPVSRTEPAASPAPTTYASPATDVAPPQPPTHYAAGGYGVPHTPTYSGRPYTPPTAGGIPAERRTAPARRRGESVLIAVLAVLCVVSMMVSIGLGIYVLSGDSDNTPDSVTEQDDQVVNENGPTLQISSPQDVDDGGLLTSEIVNKNINATVVLTMYHKSSTVDYYSSFFGYYGGGGSNDSLTEVSAASGIIMSEDGYIITNSHCVFDEDYETEYARLDVTLYDGRVFENATIVGYDRSTDLAVIKIDATGLTAAEFGDSSALSLGDRVVTLGNSGGLSWSVSQGILSGQARDVYEDTGYAIKCLQVDAVINPGSSGGPLINAYGQVVGVNSAKIVMEGHEGLGFSIPINEAKTIIDDLIRYGYATGRVSIGIMGRTVTSIGYEGFIIEEINTDSPLKATDAAVGDIITHVNGVRVMNYEEMRTELTKGKVGDTVTLTLIRLDRQTRKVTEFDIKVKLAEMK